MILAEFVVPQFVIFFFGIGALINALLMIALPRFASQIPLQILIWALTSSISLFALRRYAAGWFRGRSARPDEDADAGRTAEVVEAITPGAPGRIRYGGTTWKAISFDEEIPVGAIVTILKKENLSYLVTRGDLLGDS